MHTIILIHGMGHGNQTDKDYEKLKKRLARAYTKRYGGQIGVSYKFLDVKWLCVTTRYEEQLMKLCFPRNDVRTFSPLRMVLQFRQSLRYLMSFFIGDVIAYTSDNNNGIRSTVLDTIRDAVVSGEYSIAAHSLGAVIAFDFLFHLFPPAGEAPGFFACGEGGLKEIDAARRNFRHFFSFGAPVSLFMLRRLELIPGLSDSKDLINPCDQAGRGSRWLNFMGRLDPVAYPAEILFDKPSAVKDIRYLNALFFVFAHLRYWGSRRMAKEIVEVLESETEPGRDPHRLE